MDLALATDIACTAATLGLLSTGLICVAHLVAGFLP